VHAYPQQIGTGWGGGGAKTFVYNGTILMRDIDDVWCKSLSTQGIGRRSRGEWVCLAIICVVAGNELFTQVINNSIYTPGPVAATEDELGGQCCAPECPSIKCPQGPNSVRGTPTVIAQDSRLSLPVRMSNDMM
jgi:hypothetical protein